MNHGTRETSPGAGRPGRAAVVAAVLIPLAILAVVAARMHHNAFAEARERLERAARIAQEHAARVVETSDVLARVILQEAGDASDAELRDRREDAYRLLRDLTGNLEQIQSIWLWDRAGAPLWSSRFAVPPASLNVSDREYFVGTREGRYDHWYVSQPLRSRSTGEPFVDFARRRTLADGQFAGVVSVSLFPAYFARFYRDLAEREPHLAVALVRKDGHVIARWPEVENLETRLSPESPLVRHMSLGTPRGETKGRSSIDGEERLVHFRAVEGLPLYVAGSLPVGAVMAGWRTQVLVLAAFVAPLAGALVVLALLALRRADREAEALQRFQLESAQRMRAEEALRQAQKLEALGRITGSVAHDFNNLLMVVSNNALLLTRLSPQAAEQPQLAAIQRAVASGTKLTRQLLSFARRQPLQPTVLSLAAALPDLADLVRTAVGKRIEVVERVASDLPPIEADPNELELALLNMAVNARDAMPDGGRLLIVARRATAAEVEDLPDGDYLALSMSDSGLGMDQEVLRHVFEPFFTTKPPGKGTGLGLAQVYGFAKQSNGTATIDSEPGVGTTVTLYFPVTTRAISREAVPVHRELPVLSAALLYVEDNLEVAGATTPLLQATGCRVTHAGAADEAMQLLSRERFDLVLSDIVMPGDMNGLALARTIRKYHPSVPIVLMTGYTAELHQALAEGFEVLPKPCAAATLVDALARALNRHPMASPEGGGGTRA